MAITINGDTGISSIGALSGVTSVSSASADTPVILQDSSSNSNTCRAWVNFNGTSTVAIRADFNVSSITDNGTGDYTVNFTTAMPDANYSSNVNAGGTSAVYQGAPYDFITARTASLLRVVTLNTTNSAADAAVVNVAIFR